MWTVATYVLKKRLAGNNRYPLVLMLEPLFRCNLACAGCGKVQYPPHILKKQLTPEECFAAVEECGAPMVSIPGGEPLLHPQIVEIVNGLIARKKYIYLCTNALELKRRLPEFTPSKYLTFSVHLDGQREHHDFSVCREGGYDIAVEGIKEAVKRGFRVTTNATFFDGTAPNQVRGFFDDVMEMGVEGIVLSPGYSYEMAPDQHRFLGRARVRRLFRAILSNRKPTWKFNMSPLFLDVPDGRPQGARRHRGVRRRTTSSAGRGPATCCKTATRRPSKNCLKPPSGKSTAWPAATPSAPTAWSAAAMSRAP
jgi:hopanoid biosynthesis associated radical SAM protein HpnH